MPQINLYYTDSINELQHDCLRFISPMKKSNDNRKIISYCLSELPSKFSLENNDYFSKFTFAQLSTQNITTQQLYLWSASIDLIERYQLYLNDSSSTTAMFYNCTLPRFGSMCQYEFVYYRSHHSSLYEIIQDFYRTYEYEPTTFTCYEHLQCNRGPDPICLDWTEICNGKLDCLDSRLDEENCWQLEVNECQENEYRCKNGQCIPQSFYLDHDDDPFCLDKSDIGGRWNFNFQSCYLNIPDEKFCMENEYIKIIENNCSNMFYFPNVPFLFRDIYMVYNKNDIRDLLDSKFQLPYICYNNSRYDDYFIDDSKILFNNSTCYRRKLTAFRPILLKSWVKRA